VQSAPSIDFKLAGLATTTVFLVTGLMNFRAFGLTLLTLSLAFPVVAQTGDPVAGQGKIGTCVACHGNDGKALIPVYPNIGGQGESYLLKQMLDIRNGDRSAPEMLPFVAGLSDQDLRDIAAYYAQQPKTISGAQLIANENFNLVPEDFLALGERLYRSGNHDTGIPACSGCHSPTGFGNAPAGYPALSGQNRDYVIKTLTDFQNNVRTNDGDVRLMRGVVARMSRLEIEAVANYISGLH
jgi:cytochrome c553